MQPIDKQQIEDFICSQGWEYREVGDQFQILSGCPFCGDTGQNHFYISQSKNGAYNCFLCSTRGNLYDLRKKLIGVNSTRLTSNQPPVSLKKKSVIQNQEDVTEKNVRKYEQSLWKETKILDWLRTTRGFKDETIKKWRLGWDGNRIVIPIYQRGGLVTLRYRQNPFAESNGSKYMSHPGSQIALFNQDCLEKKVNGTCVVEGEFDAIILMQEWGNDAVVSSTGGSGSWNNDWSVFFREIKRINIIFDNDEAGANGAEKLSKQLGWFKCYNVVISKKDEEKKIDITDFLVRDKHSFKELQRLMMAAKPFPEVSEEGITPIRDILPIAKEHIVLGKKIRGVITGYDYLDAMLEGFRPGDLIILSGKTGTGKTFISQAFAMNMAEKGDEVMFFSLEMLPSELVQRFIALEANAELSHFASAFKGSALLDDERRDIDNSISRLENRPIYFYTGDRGLNFAALEQVTTTAVKKYNAQIIIIDHLHYFVRGSAEGRSVEIGDLVRQIKLLARRLEIPIFLISHLRKIGDYTVRPDIDDLRDCLPAGQLIYSNGKRKLIENMVAGDPIVSLGKSLSLQNDECIVARPTGKKKIYELTTKLGRKIECSKNHKFFACTYGKGAFGPNNNRGLQGWTELKDLSVGQKIAVVWKYPEYIGEQTMTKNQATLLGIIIGDGHINKNYYCEITTNTLEEARLFKSMADSEFALNCSIRKYSTKKAYRLFLSNGDLKVNGRKTNNLKKWLKEIKINAVGKDKCIPAIVFRQPSSVISAFLRGLFHADGSISKSRSMCAVTLSTISPKLANQVSHLLLRLSVLNRISPQKSSNSGFRSKHISNIVTITANDILRFKKKIGFLLEKQKKLEKIAAIHNFNDRKDKNMDVFFDKIKSIEFVGIKETFDLQAKGKHASLKNNSYCVQDFITHNTSFTGQDADIVMFVRRNKLADENTVDFKSGIKEKFKVEIIVAKNRHGVEGIQTFYFQENNMRLRHISELSKRDADA